MGAISVPMRVFAGSMVVRMRMPGGMGVTVIMVMVVAAAFSGFVSVPMAIVMRMAVPMTMLMLVTVPMSVPVVVIAATVLVRMIMAVIVIVSMVMLATIRLLRADGGEIIESQHHQPDAAPQHHGSENAVRGEIVDDAATHVEVEHDSAPQQEQQRAEEMNADASSIHGGIKDWEERSRIGQRDCPGRSCLQRK
jgi:hypothetical protein